MKNGMKPSNGLHPLEPTQQNEGWEDADCFISSAQVAVQDAIAKQLREGLPVPVWHEGRVVDLRVLKGNVMQEAAEADASTDTGELAELAAA
jgi:hypothetical protein